MKDFIEKYPEMAKIFYKHARNSGDYIPDYKYEEVAEDLIAEILKDIQHVKTRFTKGAEDDEIFACNEIIIFLEQKHKPREKAMSKTRSKK